MVQAPALQPLPAPKLPPPGSSSPSLLLPSLWLCPWLCSLSLRPRQLLSLLLSLQSQSFDAPPGQARVSPGALLTFVGTTTQRSLRSSQVPQVRGLYSCILSLGYCLPLTAHVRVDARGFALTAAGLLHPSALTTC